MKSLENLKGDAATVRQYVKQNLSDELIELFYAQKDETIPLLLKAKILPDQLLVKFVSKQDQWFLFNQCVENGFTPPASFLQSLKDQGDEKFVEVLKSYPSFPWDFSFTMEILNEEMYSSFLFLFENRAEYQKPELVVRLLKEGIQSSFVEDLALQNNSLCLEIIEDINEGNLYKFRPSFLNQLVLSVEGVTFDFETFIKCPLSADAYTKLLRNKPKKKSNPYGYNFSSTTKTTVSYSPAFEEVEPKRLFNDILLEDVPKGSYFRFNYLHRNVDDADTEEIVDLFSRAAKISGHVIIKIIRNYPTSFLDKLDFEVVENSISPTDLANGIGADEDKALYLLERLPSKFNTALRKVIPMDKIPEEKNIRKKSYYNEAFKALKDGKIEDFRSALSHGYSLNKFEEDTHQKSKQRSCELVYLNFSLVMKFNKEELMILSKTPFRFNLYSEDDDFKLPSLTVEEALELLRSDKFNDYDIYEAVGNKEDFLRSGEISEDTVRSIFSHKRDQIIKNTNLFHIFLSRVKDAEVTFDADSAKDLAKQMSAEDLRKFLKVEEYEIPGIIDLKAADGEFFFTKEKVMSLCKNRYYIEDESFLLALIRRDRSLALEMVEAYLGGNKTLSAFIGEPVRITRKAVQRFEKHLEELQKSTESVVEEIFENGGKYEEFTSKLLDWKSALKEFGNGRKVVIGYISSSSLVDIIGTQGVSWEVNKLKVGTTYRSVVDQEELASLVGKCVVKTLDLSNFDSEKVESDVLFLKGFIADMNISSPVLISGDTKDKVVLLMNSISFEGQEEFLNQVIEGQESLDSLNALELEFLSNQGLVISKEVAEKILESSSHKDDVVNWLADRLGTLEGFALEWDMDDEEPTELYNLLKSKGVSLLSPKEYELYTICKDIESAGINFEPVSISTLSTKQKIYLIKFLEEKVDSRFASLNLTTLNLDTLDEIGSYDSIKSVFSQDDKDLISSFLIPSQVSNNKKIMKALRELIAVTGASVSFKVQALRSTVETINPKLELTFSDFIDYSNQAVLDESDTLKAISYEILKTIDAHYAALDGKVSILQGKAKAEVLRFIRTASARENDYVRDTLEMIRSVINGVDAYKENLKVLKEQNATEAQINELQLSIDSILERLSEVVVMDDVEHMHDRLVPLCGFIKNDPVQPLGQDKYRGLERSDKFNKDLGFRLFFPRTRADLTYLGDKNGWCVNNHSSYGDNVIKQGNILVGICEPGMPAARENVIALAHYVHEGNGNYHLEQLRRPKNQNATSEFDSNKILRYIKEHQAQIKNQEK